MSYAFQTQRNFRVHVFVGTFAIGLGLFLHLDAVEMAIVGLTIGAVLAMELLNTALESVVDLTVKQSYHELAKIAKDCAAAAVLVSSLAAICVAGSLLLPKLWLLVESHLLLDLTCVPMILVIDNYDSFTTTSCSIWGS